VSVFLQAHTRPSPLAAHRQTLVTALDRPQLRRMPSVSAWLSLKMLWIWNSQETAEFLVAMIAAQRIVLKAQYAD
jgi:hypothetical protein